MGHKPTPRHPKELKDEIIDKIKNTGLEVRQAEKIYGVSTKTIYRWLKELQDPKDGKTLEISRLRREKEELLQIIGELTRDIKKKRKLESLKELNGPDEIF